MELEAGNLKGVPEPGCSKDLWVETELEGTVPVHRKYYARPNKEYTYRHPIQVADYVCVY